MLYAKITDDGVNYFRPHAHEHHEISFVLSGEGNFFFGERKIPFYPGCIFVVAPGVVHSVKSNDDHKIISIGGNFEKNMFLSEDFCRISDNEYGEAKMLAEAILRNIYVDEEYVENLCKAYIRFIVMNTDKNPDIYFALKKIMAEIELRFDDPMLNVAEILNSSGYAEDYIRFRFREITKTTPLKYLNSVRMRNARTLINLYDFSVSEIAQRCGIPDAQYFSKLFKRHYGMSPRNYKKGLKH